ncbi:hypothetical protein HAX54_038507 [Datura stramonium]|uniref:F-box domain-containing protein n=1 Tax=Datura stramonium TaxID=4076 RepID=A0ABS8SI14_DATST|nr:hypothetical protein [Datura stramonium]
MAVAMETEEEEEEEEEEIIELENLPNDVVESIFSRIPLKSLVRLKTKFVNYFDENRRLLSEEEQKYTVILSSNRVLYRGGQVVAKRDRNSIYDPYSNMDEWSEEDESRRIAKNGEDEVGRMDEEVWRWLGRLEFAKVLLGLSLSEKGR